MIPSSYHRNERFRGNSAGDPPTARSVNRSNAVCYKCKQSGHIARFCDRKKLWCSFCRTDTHTDAACRNKNIVKKDKVQFANIQSEEPKLSELETSFAFSVKHSCSEVKITPQTSLLVDCGATAHIITDKSKFTRFDESFRPDKHYIELADGTKSNDVALARGDVSIRLKDVNGRCVDATLTNALYVPSCPQNIFSVQAVTSRGASVTFQPDRAELVNHDGTKFTVVKRGRLYFLGICDGAVTCDCTNYACDVSDWHEILGHCNYDDILKLERIVDGMKVTGKSEKPGDCSACLLGKMTQGRSRKPRARATVPLELVHTDLAGPIEPVSTEGFKYAISFTVKGTLWRSQRDFWMTPPLSGRLNV